MEVFCWEGDWGLPSIDIDCLHVMAHMKFSETPAIIKPSRNPITKRSVKNFPMLKKEDGEFLHGADDIVKYLQENDYHPDIGLKPQQYADVVCFKALVINKIYSYMKYCLWMDSKNFTEFSRPAYAKKCAFPFNFILPGRLYRDAMDYIYTTRLHPNTTADEIGDQLYLEAADSINLLSSYLGDKDFFFGDRPTSFDALAFAYLAFLVKANLASTKLQNHVRACENLVKYVSRILARYFQKETEVKEKSTSHKSNESSEKSHEWVIPVAIGSAVMLMYAAHIGLLAKLRK